MAVSAFSGRDGVGLGDGVGLRGDGVGLRGDGVGLGGRVGLGDGLQLEA